MRPLFRALLLTGAFASVVLPLVARSDPPPLPRLDRDGPLSGAIRVLRDQAYVPGSDNPKHRLDLYLPPAGVTDFPVFVFVHGGAWKGGDRAHYVRVGESLAPLGLGVALPSYRLTPEVRHPEHALDVARAVAWVGRHIGAHGGARGRIVLGGHSAGAHLAALVGLDPRYLKDVALADEPPAQLRAIVPVAGVYHLAPYLDHDGWAKDVVREVFGATRDALDLASPVRHARADAPPFLVLHGTRDPVASVLEADLLIGALEARGAKVASLIGPEQDHGTVLSDLLVEDTVARARLLEFVRETAK